MSRTEVTVTQYAACEAAGACQPRAGIPQEPVDRWGAGVPTQWLTWDQAGAFCAWAGGRRCTEAEWEWAARNGPAGDPYPWGTKPSDCNDAVWTLPACPRAGPEPPCARKAGAWGLCDLAGNVLEWVEDDWHPTYAGAPADGTAWVDTPRAGKRVLKGGSYAHVFEDGIRSAWRDRANPGDSAAMFGARCCATFE